MLIPATTVPLTVTVRNVPHGLHVARNNSIQQSKRANVPIAPQPQSVIAEEAANEKKAADTPAGRDKRGKYEYLTLSLQRSQVASEVSKSMSRSLDSFLAAMRLRQLFNKYLILHLDSLL